MNFNDKTILVTGGFGYIGSPLVGLLLNSGYNVIVIDNLSFGGETLLGTWYYPNFKFIKGDIRNINLIRHIFDDYSIYAVIHLAAIVGDPACARQPRIAKETNWDASLHLLSCSMKNKVKRFIFASSCSNYGKMSDPSGYVDENSPLAPISLYAELKVKFDNLILNDIKKKDGFCSTSLRFATVYGVSPRMRFDLTVNEFTKELSLGRELEVFGEQFWRPYCHVYDIARAVKLVLESNEKQIAYNVFNVGDTAENYNKKMIVEEIKKFIPGAKVNYVRKDEDPRDYRVSFEKIKTDLAFSITRKLNDGIKEIKDLIDSNVFFNPDDNKYRNS